MSMSPLAQRMFMQSKPPAPIKRFDFFNLRDFTNPTDAMLPAIEHKEELAAPPPPPPPPTFSEEQLERTKTESYAAGLAEGMRQAEEQQNKAQRETEQQHLHMMQSLASHLSQADEHFAKHIQNQEQQLLALASGIAVKLVGHALMEGYEGVLERMLRDTLPSLLSMPTLTIMVHDSAQESIQSMMRRLSEEYGYTGNYQINPAASMRAGDIRIEWAHGAAERSLEHMIESVASVLPLPNIRIPEPITPIRVRSDLPREESFPHEATQTEHTHTSGDLHQKMLALRARKSST
jgi:flagellar assembly protein FliH